MRKSLTKIGVGQLTLTFGDEPKDETEETQDNGSGSSDSHHAVGSRKVPRAKWHSLIDKVYALPNLQAAWERVRKNRGAAGVDGVTIRYFEKQPEAHILALHGDLKNKTYRPKPVRRVEIPKSGGGTRPLGIPTVRDRIVQQALLQVLEPIFEEMFSNSSHGFRKERGCATAIAVVDKAIRHGYSHVVDADISKFFDTVNHDRLIDAVNERVADGQVLRLIMRILTAGVIFPNCSSIEPTELGTPQGGPISPLLANIYLHKFDVQIKAAGYGLVRYADDFVIFAKSEGEALEALNVARDILEGEMGLKLHPEKTRVVSVASGFEFLGFHYFEDEKSGKRCKDVRQKSVANFRHSVRERTPRLHAHRWVKQKHVTIRRLRKNKRVKELIVSVNSFLRGWYWYFKSIDGLYERQFLTYDGFVRRRLRSAIVGRVGNGWWTFHMTNVFMRNIGYVGLEDLDSAYRDGLLTAPARKG